MELIKPLKIRDVILKNNILTAPMAGVTDLPFRKELDRFEPGLIYTEMVSCNAIKYECNKTRKLLDVDGIKSDYGFQMFGSDLDAIEYTTKFLSDNYDMKILDFNMGCPAPKIIRSNSGSFLLSDIQKSKKILQTIVKNSRVPVTIKIRLGYVTNEFVGKTIAKMAEDVGISAITVHGRYTKQYYSGISDIEKVKEIKQSVQIPVIGNGDITSYEMAKKYLEYAQTDGIMIARGMFGKPWLIEEIKRNDKQEKFEISNEEKLEIILEHLDYSNKYKGQTGIKEFRKHLAQYSKNYPNACEFRKLINNSLDIDFIKDSIIKYLGN